MSQDEYTILFWGSRRMVFTELGKITLIFDKELFFTKTRQELQRVMSEAEVGSHMTAFTFQLRTEELHRHNVQKFERVSRLMFKKIERGEIDINIKTGYAYDGPKDVNEVLEDCLAAVSLNSDCVWTTGKPLMNDDSNLAVTVQQIRPLSWIKRKLNIQPNIVRDITFESGKATHIAGNCTELVITVAGQKLRIHTHGFDWLR